MDRDGMKLWEIGDEMEAVMIATIDRETGEISEEGMAELQAVEMKFQDKALAVGKFVAGQRLEANAIMEKALELKRRAEKLLNHANRLEQYYLAQELFEAGIWIKEPDKRGEEVLLKDAETEIIAKKSIKTEEVCMEDTPEEFRRIIPPVPESWAPDKKAILKALQGGINVEGWTLEKTVTIEVT